MAKETHPLADAMGYYVDPVTGKTLPKPIQTLLEVREAIIKADQDVLTCTLWMPEHISKGATVVDHIDATLIENGIDPENLPSLKERSCGDGRGNPRNTGNPYEDGYKAYAMFSRSKNPYSEGTQEYVEWFKGFDTAQSKGDGRWYD